MTDTAPAKRPDTHTAHQVCSPLTTNWWRVSRVSLGLPVPATIFGKLFPVYACPLLGGGCLHVYAKDGPCNVIHHCWLLVDKVDKQQK